ncbi:MAG: aldo/keto reductase [Lacunisphaera sp.]|nr:aldo/keto reductase [Lacunisphaera sp.]
MQTARFADLELSTLILGTVQFGLNYGIANKSGQPSYRTVLDILAAAHEGGVNCFDTAVIYGNSEEVLGKALAELGLKDKFIAITKVRHMDDDFSSSQAADEFVEESVTGSLRRLGLDVLPICLFHAEGNFRYVESLLKLKDKGLVRHIGSSVNTPEATASIIASGCAEALQIPTSILDHRFTRGGIFRDAKQHGIAIFVRSVYLQGLALMAEEEIPEDIGAVIPVRRKLQELASEAGMVMEELAARYVLSLPGFTCAVVGIETVQQVRHNTSLFAKKPLEPALVQAIEEIVTDLPDNILKPGMWSKRMADVKPIKR